MKVKGKKGQVLVIVLGLVFVLYALSLFIIETGRFVTAKMHLQNTADSVAMESGIWYARSLNMASLINKVRYVTSFVQNAVDGLLNYILDKAYDHLVGPVCGKFGKVGEWACKKAYKIFKKAAIPVVEDMIDYSFLAPITAFDQTVAKVQVQFKTNIPVIFVYTNALKNLVMLKLNDDMYCFPCFTSILPSLDIFTNYERTKKNRIVYRYFDRASNKTKEASQSDVVFDPKANKWKLKRSPYYYTDRIVKTEKDKDQRDADAAAKKSIEQLQTDAERKAAEDTLKSSLLTQYNYIEETGKQAIFVICMKKYKPMVASRMWPEKWLVAAAKVRIEGGSMSIFDYGDDNGGGSHYYPKLENIGVAETFTTVETAMVFIDKTLGKFMGFNAQSTVLGEFIDVMAKVDH